MTDAYQLQDRQIERRVITDGHGGRLESTGSRYPADRYALVVAFDVEALDLATPEDEA